MSTTFDSIDSATSRALVGGVEAFRFNQTGIISGSPAGFRNRIINGGMHVAQRTAPNLSGSYQYGQCDRWQFLCSGGTGISGTIFQNAYTAFSSGYSGGVAAASWTNGQFFAQQRIEAKNVADLGSKTMTISARIYQDTGSTRSFYLMLVRATGGIDNWTSQVTIGTSAALPVISASPIQVSATFNLGANDNLNGLAVVIYDTATNTVSNKSYQVGDVQLELGSVATTFEQRPYGLELALCQRHFQVFQTVGQMAGTYWGGVTSTFYCPTINLPVVMRAAGTFAVLSTGVAGAQWTNPATASYSLASIAGWSAVSTAISVRLQQVRQAGNGTPVDGATYFYESGLGYSLSAEL